MALRECLMESEMRRLIESTEEAEQLLRNLDCARSVRAREGMQRQPEFVCCVTRVAKVESPWGQSLMFVALRSWRLERFRNGIFAVFSSGKNRGAEIACALSPDVDTDDRVNCHGEITQHGHDERVGETGSHGPPVPLLPPATESAGA